MPHAAIALGGNQGAVVQSFRTACQRLSRCGIIMERMSSIYETAPVGESRGNYLNAAVLIETHHAAEHLLEILHETESAQGRVREQNWDSRPLDLDLVWYDELVCETPRLTLPHPACWYRQFVLFPLAEVCPEWVHPLKQTSVRDLKKRFSTRPLRLALTGGIPEKRRRLLRQYGRPASGVEMHDFADLPESTLQKASHDLTIIAWLGATPPLSTRDVPEQIRRPQSESQHPDFLRLPRANRLDVSREAGGNHDEWLNFLLQAMIDVPRLVDRQMR